MLYQATNASTRQHDISEPRRGEEHRAPHVQNRLSFRMSREGKHIVEVADHDG